MFLTSIGLGNFSYAQLQYAASFNTSSTPLGSGTKEDPYQITNSSQISKLGGDGRMSSFVLLQNIEIDEHNPIDFYGTFDGNGFTITINSFSNSFNNTGFFGTLNGATIKNLNINYLGSPYLTCNYFGAIAGYAESSNIINCNTFERKINITASNGSTAFGGIVGEASNTKILKCINRLRIFVTNELYSSNSIYLGGIAGCCDGEISYCTNIGYRIEDKLTCISLINRASADIFVGGIVGFGESKLDYCFNYGHLELNNSYQFNSSSREINFGGLAGVFENGTFSNSFNKGLVAFKNDNSIKAEINMGGLIGMAQSTNMSNCIGFHNMFDDYYYVWNELGQESNVYYKNNKTDVNIDINIGGICGEYLGGNIVNVADYNTVVVSLNMINNPNIQIGGLLGYASDITLKNSYKAGYAQQFFTVYTFVESKMDCFYIGGIIGYGKNIDASNIIMDSNPVDYDGEKIININDGYSIGAFAGSLNNSTVKNSYVTKEFIQQCNNNQTLLNFINVNTGNSIFNYNMRSRARKYLSNVGIILGESIIEINRRFVSENNELYQELDYGLSIFKIQDIIEEGIQANLTIIIGNNGGYQLPNGNRVEPGEEDITFKHNFHIVDVYDYTSDYSSPASSQIFPNNMLSLDYPYFYDRFEGMIYDWRPISGTFAAVERGDFLISGQVYYSAFTDINGIAGFTMNKYLDPNYISWSGEGGKKQLIFADRYASSIKRDNVMSLNMSALYVKEMGMTFVREVNGRIILYLPLKLTCNYGDFYAYCKMYEVETMKKANKSISLQNKLDILDSSNWNMNGDVDFPEEVWFEPKINVFW